METKFCYLRCTLSSSSLSFPGPEDCIWRCIKAHSHPEYKSQYLPKAYETRVLIMLMLVVLQYLVALSLISVTFGHPTSNTTTLVDCLAIYDNSPLQSDVGACRDELNKHGRDNFILEPTCTQICNIGTAFVSGQNQKKRVVVSRAYIADAIQEIAEKRGGQKLS
jgi:hypothetical protein